MEIIIQEQAYQWFKKEMDIEAGDTVRFYARYGGSSPFHEAFSLGMNREQPHTIGVQTKIDGVVFYIEQDDLWFFNEHSLVVSIDEKLNELQKKKKK